MNSYSSRVNQKLHFAEISLKRLQNETNKTDHATRISDEEAFLFHLHGAFHAFLQEIASQYQLDTHDMSFLQLVKRFQAAKNANFMPAEMAEIEVLMGDITSWLRGMITDYHALFEQKKTDKMKQNSTLGNIPLVDVGQIMGFSVEKAGNYMKNMKNLVNRLRSLMEEW